MSVTAEKTKMVMVLDTRKCVGCSACVVACKEENGLDIGGFRCWVVNITDGEYPNLRLENRSERCNHCENASCITNCPTGASYRAEDGSVQIDRSKCTGCKDCLSACPYSARYVDNSGIIDKCTFCAHMENSTACQEACPSECIVFGDASDDSSEVNALITREKVKVLKPESGAWPQVYYLI